MPFLRCVRKDEAKQVFIEVHEGVCENHSRGQAQAHKVLHMGYYWPNIQQDSSDFAQSYDKCQQFALCPRLLYEELTSITSSWSFSKWGIDLIGPLSKAHGQMKYVLVAINYYTKLVEAKP